MRPFLILSICLWLAGSLRAQTKEIVKEVEAKLEVERASQRNEDIEVLRLLMNKSFGFANKTELRTEIPVWMSSTTTPPGSNTSWGSIIPLSDTPKTLRSAHQEFGPFDAVYLPGAGVIFTLRVPAGVEVSYDSSTQALGFTASCAKCHTTVPPNDTNHKISVNTLACNTCHRAGTVSGDAPGKALTDWDRAKLELRGEKPSVAAVPVKPVAERAPICQPGNVSDQLQRLLFAYAKNIGPMGEKDKFTVVITFDETPGAKPQIAPPTERLGFTPEESQKLTLGDLHMKQQKYDAALAAYRAGLARFQVEEYRLTLPSNLPWAEGAKAIEELQTRVRDLHKQVALAQLSTQDLDGAKASLTLAKNFKVVVANPTAGAKPWLPAKMIVSVPALALQNIVDYAAFQKIAKVEYQNFPVAKPQPSK